MRTRWLVQGFFFDIEDSGGARSIAVFEDRKCCTEGHMKLSDAATHAVLLFQHDLWGTDGIKL